MGINTLPSDKWFKSSRSDGANACVEANKGTGHGVGVRDSKANGQGPVLLFGETNWTSFVADIKAGRYSG
ncbi:DUF397 domain-containing protein [Micromonospora maritima]|uniref:DUF397 domain-containing protein n=1 Tax=Micromonospora maritima TaxID=986711 RepID=UPI00157D7D2F|nr:DUF397 domain-containing protein [Micromonospora maritima]